jgi:hypothetical protein
MRAEVTMALQRRTKGAVLYREVDGNNNPVPQDEAVIRNIYVRKTALDGNAPERLNVVISDETRS